MVMFHSYVSSPEGLRGKLLHIDAVCEVKFDFARQSLSVEMDRYQ